MLRSLIPAKLRMAVRKRAFISLGLSIENVKFAFSQEGEDLLLDRLLSDNSTGYYVDVGAHHPFKHSNTAFFYRKGWRGINIDPLPGAMQLFSSARKRDVNLSCAIGEVPGELDYYIFDWPELNGFSSVPQVPEASRGLHPVKAALKVPVVTLSAVLEEHLPRDTEIDFLTIDVEGFDLQVLRSNDWSRFTPRFILVEDHQFDLINPNQSAVYRFLHDRGYDFMAKTYCTLFFRRRR